MSETKRVPRKKKKQIPEGLYCYKGLKFDWETGIYHIKTCPFYGDMKLKDMPNDKLPTWIDDEYLNENGDYQAGWCKLVKCEIDDQCKSCGIKKGY